MSRPLLLAVAALTTLLACRDLPTGRSAPGPDVSSPTVAPEVLATIRTLLGDSLVVALAAQLAPELGSALGAAHHAARGSAAARLHDDLARARQHLTAAAADHGSPARAAITLVLHRAAAALAAGARPTPPSAAQ